MSNGINSRENERCSINMLGAQRKLYNDAKRADAIKIFLSVLLPFALSVLLLFISEESVVGTLFYSVSILGVIVSFLVSKYIKKKKELAATIQQHFDTYVYHMPWNDKLFGKKKNLNNEIIEHSKKLFKKKGEKEKLLDWYPESVDTKTLEEGIIVCQRENCWWDAGLRKRYKTFSIVLITGFVLVVIILGIVNNESVIKLLWRSAFIAPMVQWLLETIDSLDEDIDRLSELSDTLNGCGQYQMNELQEIQQMIFEHRKNCQAIPNIVYKLFKNNDEDKARQIASM